MEGRGGGGSGAGRGGGSPERLISSAVDGEEDDDHHGTPGNNGYRGGGGGAGGNGHPRPHHSHGLGGEDDGIWVRLALLIALSVHSVMEGLGVGAKETKAYNLLLAIACHKVRLRLYLCVCVCACVSPDVASTALTGWLTNEKLSALSGEKITFMA